MRGLTEHFSVRDDQIQLEPGRLPSIGDRLADVLSDTETTGLKRG